METAAVIGAAPDQGSTPEQGGGAGAAARGAQLLEEGLDLVDWDAPLDQHLPGQQRSTTHAHDASQQLAAPSPRAVSASRSASGHLQQQNTLKQVVHIFVNGCYACTDWSQWQHSVLAADRGSWHRAPRITPAFGTEDSRQVWVNHENNRCRRLGAALFNVQDRARTLRPEMRELISAVPPT